VKFSENGVVVVVPEIVQVPVTGLKVTPRPIPAAADTDDVIADARVVEV
jgi:hypothetical protein